MTPDTHATKPGTAMTPKPSALEWYEARVRVTVNDIRKGLPDDPHGDDIDQRAARDGADLLEAELSMIRALSERVRVLEDNLATILDAYRLAMMALGRDAAAFDRSQEVIAARAALAGGGK